MGARGDIRRVAALATRQHGNVTLAQLQAMGLSRGEIEDRCSDGWLIRRHTGVYAVGHVPRTPESCWCAGVLALGAGAVLSHVSAGALWGMLSRAAVTEVIVPTTAGHRNRDGIVVHRQQLPADHRTVRNGIPVTTPIRTLLDLAAVLPITPLAKAFEQAQVWHHVSPAPLAAEVIARPRQRGNAKLRRILADAVDPADVRSVLELRFLRMCASHGIPRPQVNVRVGRWTPDFLWPDRRIVVETDGFDFHRTAAARRRDAEKDEFFRRLGYAVMRVTWADVAERPGFIAAGIRGGTNVTSALDGVDEVTYVARQR
jgi:very-short-patch-repair endonuclease